MHRSSEEPAQNVVKEIQETGGKAVAAFGDVADWEAAQGIVQTAVDTFGDLNIMVNNAGFSRDGMIVKMSEDQFDSVLREGRSVTRASLALSRNQPSIETIRGFFSSCF